MRTAIMLALLATLLVASTATARGPQPYWLSKTGCDHGHRSKVSYERTTRVLRNYTPFTKEEGKRVRHYVACVTTKAKKVAVKKHVLRLLAWRKSYRPKWRIQFNRLPAWDRQWAISTSSCESGMNPATNTGNGFYGAFQFMLSTWHAAGGTGMPNQHSWHYQAVIAVSWMHRSSPSQWPICGV